MIPDPFVSDIQEVVSAAFGLDPLEMKSARRMRAVARPRQIAMFLCRALTRRSLPEIGELFGDRDHSTVIHAVRVTEDRLRRDGEEADQVRMICASLAARVAARPHRWETAA